MFHYKPTLPIASVTIFGAGGTGARVAQLVCQQLQTEEYTKNVKVIIMDGDIVEPKNCKRQLFLSSEVGKNKADVVAARYKRVFDSKTMSVPYFMPGEDSVSSFFLDSSSDDSHLQGIKHLAAALYSRNGEEYNKYLVHGEFYPVDLYKELSRGLNIFIIAVDTIEARQSILLFLQMLSLQKDMPRYSCSTTTQLISMSKNLLIIDGGNEDTFGQVNYFHPVQFGLCPLEDLSILPKQVPLSFNLPAVPMPTGRYKNMKPSPSTRRCGDMDQTLAINTMVATNMFLIFQNLFYFQEMSFHTIRFGLSGYVETSWMTMDWLKGVISTDKDYAFGTLSDSNVEYRGGVVDTDKMTNVDALRYGYFLPSSRTSEATICGMYAVSTISYNKSHCVISPCTIVTSLNYNLTQLGTIKWDAITSRTSLLDVCWSELLMPILLHLKQKNWLQLESLHHLLMAIFEISSTSFLHKEGALRGVVMIEELVDTFNEDTETRKFAIGYTSLVSYNRDSKYILSLNHNPDLLLFQSQGPHPDSRLLILANDKNVPVIGSALSFFTEDMSKTLYASSGIASLGTLCTEGDYSYINDCASYLGDFIHLSITLGDPRRTHTVNWVMDSVNTYRSVFGCFDTDLDVQECSSIPFTHWGEVLTPNTRFIQLVSKVMGEDACRGLVKWMPRDVLEDYGLLEPLEE